MRTPDTQLGMFIHGLGGGEWVDYAHGVCRQCLSFAHEGIGIGVTFSDLFQGIRARIS